MHELENGKRNSLSELFYILYEPNNDIPLATRPQVPIPTPTWHIKWKMPPMFKKLILSIKNEIALLISLVSTFPGRVNDLELKPVACKQYNSQFKPVEVV